MFRGLHAEFGKKYNLPSIMYVLHTQAARTLQDDKNDILDKYRNVVEEFKKNPGKPSDYVKPDRKLLPFALVPVKKRFEIITEKPKGKYFKSEVVANIMDFLNANKNTSGVENKKRIVGQLFDYLVLNKQFIEDNPHFKNNVKAKFEQFASQGHLFPEQYKSLFGDTLEVGLDQ